MNDKITSQLEADLNKHPEIDYLSLIEQLRKNGNREHQWLIADAINLYLHGLHRAIGKVRFSAEDVGRLFSVIETVLRAGETSPDTYAKN